MGCQSGLFFPPRPPTVSIKMYDSGVAYQIVSTLLHRVGRLRFWNTTLKTGHSNGALTQDTQTGRSNRVLKRDTRNRTTGTGHSKQDTQNGTTDAGHSKQGTRNRTLTQDTQTGYSKSRVMGFRVPHANYGVPPGRGSIGESRNPTEKVWVPGGAAGSRSVGSRGALAGPNSPTGRKMYNEIGNVKIPCVHTGISQDPPHWRSEMKTLNEPGNE